MRIYNSFSRTVEDFESIKKGKVGMYTCGPTVYDYDHIGHGRKYTYDDVLRRVLTYFGYEVTHVQNITDVGHLVSDGDDGEDKMEKGAKKFGKTAWEVAKFFTQAHFDSMDLLGILRPTISSKATEHIPEQIALVQTLVDKGFAYETEEAVYFDVAKFPRYDGLFGQYLAGKHVAVREGVHTGEHKKHPEDFALWFKRVGRFVDHVMYWPSPWGEGFPGWHVECSAMAMKYLGETFDIHTGGEDHLPVHHPNEVAQSEAATGKPFARYWLHYAFLNVDGQKMSKSLGNVYRVEDVVEKGFSARALRYLYLTAHYRSPMNFTWSALAAAQSAYDKLVDFVREAKKDTVRTELSRDKLKKLDGFRERFLAAISDDLAIPSAMAVMWELLKSNIPNYDKLDQLLDWDQILGLGLEQAHVEIVVPEAIVKLGTLREELRLQARYVDADTVRVEIEKQGWIVMDSKSGPVYKKK